MRDVGVKEAVVVQCFDSRLETAGTSMLIFLSGGEETAVKMGGWVELAVLEIL